ncbi:DUF2017 domain-containing protein [soil metagenome]
MTTGFQRSRGGGAHAHFEDVEARMVASMAAQIVELLRDSAPSAAAGGDDTDPLASVVGLGADAPLPRPDDPVLARLLPDAYRDDEAEASDFRRYTEPGLRDQKASNAAAVIASLSEAGADLDVAGPAGGAAGGAGVDVELDADGVDAWLRCLTDVRLALGTRLEVAEDDEARWEQLPDEDPAKAMHDVYDWLGFVQETLLRALR